MAPDIDYRLTGHGWATCTVRFGEAQCEISASYLSDALGRLVLGAAAVASGLHSVSIGFDEEPGEYRWVVTEVAPSEVQVTILAFDDLWSRLPDVQGRQMFDFICDPSDFAEAVWLAAARVREAWPAEAYREKWGEHEFPTEALALLEARLGNPAAAPG
jgi:hypothetical protein